MPPSPDLLNILRRAVDPQVGLFSFVTEHDMQPGDPPLHLFVVTPQNGLNLPPRNKAAPWDDYRPYGSGVGLDREAALWSAIGEACERYASTIFDPADIVVAAYTTLSEPALDASRAILFSDEQYNTPGFPYRKFDPNAPIGWVRGIDLHTQESALIPASLVYMSYPPLSGADNLCNSSSSGLGAHRDYVGATLAGLYELIERDAYACNWLLARTAPHISLGSLKTHPTFPPLLQEFLSLPGCEITIRDITTDLGVPCFFAAVHSEHAPGVFQGASCNLNIRVALQKTVLELLHCFNWGQHMIRKNEPLVAREQVQDFHDHVRYYADRSRFSELAFQFAPSPTSALAAQPDSNSSPDSRSALRELLRCLRHNGFAAYAVDITPDDVRELGLVVVRVVVPGLQPLHAGYGREFADRRRLRQVAKFYGLPSEFQIYRAPHPFP